MHMAKKEVLPGGKIKVRNVEENVSLAICSVGVPLAKYSFGKRLNFSVPHVLFPLY